MIAQAQFTIADLSDAAAEVIVGTQTAATAAWKGVASFSELKDKQQIFKGVHHKGSDYLRVSEYVEKIAEKYDNLNIMLPSKYDECFSNINSFLKHKLNR